MTLASDMEPTGMFARKIPVDYQTIADPVMWAVDSENRVVDEAVDRITDKQNVKKDKTNY